MLLDNCYMIYIGGTLCLEIGKSYRILQFDTTNKWVLVDDGDDRCYWESKIFFVPDIKHERKQKIKKIENL